MARNAGLVLDPWQEMVLVNALGEGVDERWAAFEVGVVCPRQNGKNEILAARELAGLFLLGERLIIHSAHQFDTSLEAFRRLVALIEDTPEFSRRVKKVSKSHGEEGIELMNGQRVRFRTRTKGGGRGFTADCLILDEAMILPEAAHGALLPTVSANPNAQVWYTGSAVDQAIHEDGVVLARVRERGLRGDDQGLAYFEWSGGRGDPADDDPDAADAQDREAWAAANPGLGIRIREDHVEREQRSLAPRTFAVERLGIGDWPALTGGNRVIDDEAWRAMADPGSQPVGAVAFAFDVTPDRSWATVCVAGRREDGLGHVEVVEHRRGTGWVALRLAELVAAHDASVVVCDATGPAASLLSQCASEEVEVVTTTAREMAQACGAFFDALEQRGLRHLGTRELSGAVRGAATRSLGDSWAWSRKSSGVDISPLVGCTLALWGLGQISVPRERARFEVWA